MGSVRDPRGLLDLYPASRTTHGKGEGWSGVILPLQGAILLLPAAKSPARAGGIIRASHNTTPQHAHGVVVGH
jgi:hypothetical protein